MDLTNFGRLFLSLFLTLCFILDVNGNQIQTDSEDPNCFQDSSTKRSLPKCKILNAGNVNCWLRENFAIIRVNEVNRHAEIHCRAKYPIMVDFKSPANPKGVPKVIFHRNSQYFFDNSTYDFKLSILLADTTHGTGNYTFYKVDDPDIRTWIFIVRPDARSSEILNAGEGGEITAKVKDDQIILPCLKLDQDWGFTPMSKLFKWNCSDVECSRRGPSHQIAVDNDTIFYDWSKGFIVKSNFELFEGQYYCEDSDKNIIKFNVLSTLKNYFNPTNNIWSTLLVTTKTFFLTFSCESKDPVYLSLRKHDYNMDTKVITNFTGQINIGTNYSYFVATIEITSPSSFVLDCKSLSKESGVQLLHSWDFPGIDPDFDVKENGEVNCGQGLSLKYYPCHSKIECNAIQHSILNEKSIDDCSCCNAKMKGQGKTNSMKVLAGGIMQCESPDFTYSKLIMEDLNGKFYATDEITPMVIIDQLDYSIYTNISTRFRCTSHRLVSNGDLQWAFQYKTSSEISQIRYELVQDISKSISYEENPFLESDIFVPENVDVDKLFCFAPVWNSYEWINTSIELIISGVITSPVIMGNSGVREHFVFIVGDTNRSLFCESTGLPIPTLEWTRLEKDIDDYVIQVETDGNETAQQLLRFPEISHSHEGEYICNARNIAGSASSKFTVKVREPTSYIVPIVVVIVIGILISAVIPIIYLRKRLNQAENVIRTLTPREVNDFLNGNLEAAQHCNQINDKIKYMPYNRAYEIPREDIEFEQRILGTGQFGVVREGKVFGKRDPVAIKESRCDCDVEYFKSFLAELKVMIYIGKHENIVDLLGAYTGGIDNNVLYIILELCSGGSLEQHLRKNKPGIGTPNAIKDGNNQDASGNDFKITELMNWSLQIGTGMEYLASKKVIHGDLATRNVLLDSQLNAKISDFGLSRQMYNYINYTRTRTIPLPWRWLAIESLKRMEFSTKSDVWSYGVTIWEIFTCGDTPYAGLEWTIDFKDRLVDGLRLNKPRLATPKLYHVMIDCWNLVPNERPGFDLINGIVQTLLDQEIYTTFEFNDL